MLGLQILVLEIIVAIIRKTVNYNSSDTVILLTILIIVTVIVITKFKAKGMDLGSVGWGWEALKARVFLEGSFQFNCEPQMALSNGYAY